MRLFLIAFLGTVGLTLLGVPIAVHESHRVSTVPGRAGVVLPAGQVSVTPVADTDPSAVNQGDQNADRAAKADRAPAAADSADNESSDGASAPRAASGHQGTASHGRQRTIEVDLSDLVIRPV